MKLLKELSTVTPLSKYLAMVVFIAMPFLGFFLGIRYQEMLNLAKKDQNISIKACTQDAKICPDGTKVKPQPPTCEFASCPTVDPNETANPDLIGANWKTYDNEKYGFNIKYPNNWNFTTRGAGEAISAVGDESTFTIKDEMVEGKNISFDIASLGSDRLGSYYSSAKNLNDYTNLITKKDEKGNIIRKFVKESTVDNRRSLWFEIYQWEVDKQAFVWTPEIYFQDKNNIYQVRPSGTISLEIFDQILSTFRFVKQKPVIPTDKASCETKGGTWEKTGLLQSQRCDLPTSDAGESCTDSSQCESVCVADDKILPDTKTTGKCYDRTQTVGACLNLVIDGKAQGTLCAD